MDMRSELNWLELPQCIVELILNKLHYVDQIRALAVCKTLRDCKDHVRCSDRLPWVLSHPLVHKIRGDKYSFVCEFFDPYSQMAVKEFCKNVDGHVFHVLASSWLLRCMYNVLFLHNPFTDVTIRLPSDVDGANWQVSMKYDPQSIECEVYFASMSTTGYFVIRSYRILKDNDADNGYSIHDGTSGGTQTNGYDETFQVLYMDGNIYVLLGRSLHRYVLEDKKFELLTSGFPEPYESLYSMGEGWLIEINKTLMVVRLDYEDEILKWMIFRFDWCKMCLVVENGLKSCAIFISDNVAFSIPLEEEEECRLFYIDEFDYVSGSGGRVFKCFTLSDEAGWKQTESNEYEWIKRSYLCQLGFIEPPYFRI